MRRITTSVLPTLPDGLRTRYVRPPPFVRNREDSHARSTFVWRARAGVDNVDVRSARPNLGCRAISGPLGTMGRGAAWGRRPARIRSDQAVGSRAASPTDAAIPEGAGGEPRRPEERRPGQLAYGRAVPAAGYAGNDDGLPADGDHRQTGDHLYPDRPRQ